ncbi:4068_t:CDS:1 [Cetraspora pellucida]|uniref:4068_t:CDS:1 n=1 Tax=Cetraspora pellucida TaxID=1433469 RepID=A0A9N9ISI2_9GLOM|nr:4068_t:CDS:1 [Cetraspora pellucida]
MTNIQNELTYFDAELTESELHKMVKLATINDYIDDCLDNYIVDEEANRNNNTYEEDLSSLSQTNLILENVVNLQDLIFQERDTVPFEFSFNTSETSVEKNVNMNFNSEDLVDSVLNVDFD